MFISRKIFKSFLTYGRIVEKTNGKKIRLKTTASTRTTNSSSSSTVSSNTNSNADMNNKIIGLIQNEKKNSTFKLFGRSLFFFTGMGLSMFGVNEFQLQSKLKSETTGIILRRDIRRSKHSVFPQVHLSYAVNGRRYSKIDSFFTIPSLPFSMLPCNNEAVALMYDTNNPTNCRISWNKEFAGRSLMLGLYFIMVSAI